MRFSRILIGALASIALTSTVGLAASKKHVEPPEATEVEKPETHKETGKEAKDTGAHESGKESKETKDGGKHK